MHRSDCSAPWPAFFAAVGSWHRLVFTLRPKDMCSPCASKTGDHPAPQRRCSTPADHSLRPLPNSRRGSCARTPAPRCPSGSRCCGRWWAASTWSRMSARWQRCGGILLKFGQGWCRGSRVLRDAVALRLLLHSACLPSELAFLLPPAAAERGLCAARDCERHNRCHARVAGGRWRQGGAAGGAASAVTAPLRPWNE